MTVAHIPQNRVSGRLVVIAAVLFVAAGISALFWATHRAERQPIPAIAVLPFRNVSGDPANDYFSDGMTIEVIDALTKVQNLRVTSWNSAVRFRGKQANLQELRSGLQAGSVVDGSVRQQNDRLHITAQLTDTVSGQVIWSDTYDRQAKDIFRIQEEIAKSIVYSLKVQLRVDPQRILVPVSTDSVDAYKDYLHARSYGSQLSREALQQSSSYAQKAIQEDPKYAPAYALLAWNHALRGYYGSAPPSSETKRLARIAVGLEASSGEAHAALGFALGVNDWDWRAAEVEFQRATQWAPGSSDAHAAFAIAYLAPTAKFEEAEYEARRAVEIDPLSFLANDALANVLLSRGDNQKSVDQFRKALDIYDGFPAAHRDYGMALVAVGRVAEAAKEFLQAEASDYALLGESDKSRKLLESETIRPIEQARAWALLGEKDRAFQALEKAIEERDPQASFIQCDVRFKNLRDDRRYGQILRKLNFPNS